MAAALLRPGEARPAHGALREGQPVLCRFWYPGPHLAQGPGPSPQLSCEQDPSPQLCLWKESWFPRKLPGNKRHAYIFQNKLIKGLGALLFYFWQRRQSRNRGPALCDLMFAELGAAAGPQTAWLRDQPDTRPTLSAASGLRESLQDISAPSPLYPSRKCLQAVSALSPGSGEGQPCCQPSSWPSAPPIKGRPPPRPTGHLPAAHGPGSVPRDQRLPHQNPRLPGS